MKTKTKRYSRTAKLCAVKKADGTTSMVAWSELQVGDKFKMVTHMGGVERTFVVSNKYVPQPGTTKGINEVRTSRPPKYPVPEHVKAALAAHAKKRADLQARLATWHLKSHKA